MCASLYFEPTFTIRDSYIKPPMTGLKIIPRSLAAGSGSQQRQCGNPPSNARASKLR